MKYKYLIIIVVLFSFVFGIDVASGIYVENKISNSLKKTNNFHFRPKIEVTGFPALKILKSKKVEKIHMMVMPANFLPNITGNLESTLTGVQNFEKLISNTTDSYVSDVNSRISINATSLGKMMNIPDLKVMVASKAGSSMHGPGDYSRQSQMEVILGGTIKLSNNKDYKISVLARNFLKKQKVNIIAYEIYDGYDFAFIPEEKIPENLVSEALEKFSYITPQLWLPFNIKIKDSFFLGNDLVIAGYNKDLMVNIKNFRPEFLN